MIVRKKKMVLCKARHNHAEMDLLESVFPSTIDPFDFTEMHETVCKKLANVDFLELYVTGLTPALVAVLNYCTWNGIPCKLWHFNKRTGQYTQQATMCSVLKIKGGMK